MKAVEKGDVYYEVSLILESARTEKCTLEVEEWIVTKVVPLGVHFTQKIPGITWIKKSSTNGDYGFATNVDRIWKKFVPSDKTFADYDLYKTKAAAARSSLPLLKKKSNELNRILARIEKMVKEKK